ncbi:MAG: hypothetical protein WCQ97_09340 [Aminobacterium sp.]|jgi:hypothetical protein|uniref:hypothetical protein n=1 Tax=unclassified Aminobacterium TaxID=2685012 RepID=UPI001BCC3EE5|nr:MULTISPECIES: hypothetical protein [unclassified Aminobacterium]MDD2206944.1 hypothetical protein [Aminobacterium sp.]MDD3426661.1 hypothetical protein [Aminobacterium sp.]MDD3707249.1 hypothetical protein [Aminobacterium sp.]MDD4228585.1 hypothetical protein [Aminobacterium sp.]MDD4551439.1 hypothetical protein [Aminobacterium sp.]
MLSKLLRIFGIQKKSTVPLSASDIVRRARDAHKVTEWSRAKRLTVFNPPFWGIHHIFIDSNLKHSLIALKEDGSAFIFLGNTYGPERWEKYDENLNKVDGGIIENQSLTWLIYQDYVIYNGSMLPATDAPYHWGRVIEVDSFDKHIDDQWISKIIPELKELALSYIKS